MTAFLPDRGCALCRDLSPATGWRCQHRFTWWHCDAPRCAWGRARPVRTQQKDRVWGFRCGRHRARAWRWVRGAAERAADPCVLIKRRATDLDRRSPRAHGDGKGASANALRVTRHRGNARRNSGGVLLLTRRRGHHPGHRSRDLWVVAGGNVKRLGLRPHKNLYVGVCV